MRVRERQHCCGPLAAALSEEGRAAGGSCLVVRQDADGSLYFKITTGAQALAETLVNEPAAFCPFCGTPVDGTSDTLPMPLVAHEDDDEELTVVACAATLIGA